MQLNVAHTHERAHARAHTQSANNGPLYEVPTGAMVTSSFWARRAERCAKKMPWFLFFFFFSPPRLPPMPLPHPAPTTPSPNPFSNHVAQKPF